MEAAKAKHPPAEVPELPRGFASNSSPDREALLAASLKSVPRPSILVAPLTKLHGAGPKLSAAAAEGLGIESLGDLLWHLPHDYRDAADAVGIDALKLGETATIEVEVRSAKLRPTRRRGLTIVEAKVADPKGGTATAIWFNQAWLIERLAAGTRLLLQGKLDKRGFRVEAHEFLDSRSEVPEGIHTTGIVPVHPASDPIKPQKLREWAWQAAALARHTIEALPAPMRAGRRMPGAGDALAAAHFPADSEQAASARGRLAFEELLLYQAALAQRRANRSSETEAAALEPSGEIVAAWLDSLPFELTGDQRTAIEEIDADLEAAAPMQRLLMGEVGSGKTVVALYAMLRAVESGHQAALMAPTETLAEQHFAQPRAAARGRRPARRAAHRRDAGAGPPRAARASRERPARPARRHPRADRGAGRVPQPRGRGRRRAAPLRGAAARRARREGTRGPGSPRPPHDRDADPAHALADRLRRPRRQRAARAPGGPQAGRDLGRAAGGAGRVIRVPARAAARGATGVRGLPAGGRVREAAGEGGDRGGEGTGGGRARRLRSRCPPRPDALEDQGGRDEPLRRRRYRRAGGDERDRGRDRRRQRGGDRDRGGRPLRALATAPAPRARRPRRAPLGLHPVRRPVVRDGARRGSTRSRPRATASGSPRSTSGCAARARSSAPASTACRASAPRSSPRTRRCCSRPASRPCACSASTARSTPPSSALSSMRQRCASTGIRSRPDQKLEISADEDRGGRAERAKAEGPPRPRGATDHRTG